jgi:hypothetical protein
MKKLSHYTNHECCPKDWRTIKDLSGSYELDGMIARISNKKMAEKLEDHLMCDQAYQKRTAYNGSSLD